MRAFFVQIKCELGRTYDVATAVADAEIASEIHSTAGDFDLLIKFYVPNEIDIGLFVAEQCSASPASRTRARSSASRRSDGLDSARGRRNLPDQRPATGRVGRRRHDRSDPQAKSVTPRGPRRRRRRRARRARRARARTGGVASRPHAPSHRAVSAAGATDNIARIVANRLGEMWGVPIVVDNRAGAGGNIGNEAVARAEPDGSTILMGSPGLAINQYLYRQLTYDPIADLRPVTLIALVPNLLVVGRHVAATTTAELVARARANPGMTFATSGIGTSVHLSGELFKKLANVDITAVHYRGSAPATQDIIGGRVDMIFDNISQILPHVRAGSVRALGITTPRPSVFAPDIPPVAETVPGFDTTSWFGFLFPARTPGEIVAKLQADTKTALDSAAVRERLAVLGVRGRRLEPGGVRRAYPPRERDLGPDHPGRRASAPNSLGAYSPRAKSLAR
jgi:tripartite-type tricarboxylate transporter receptor subunit TctC